MIFLETGVREGDTERCHPFLSNRDFQFDKKALRTGFFLIFIQKKLWYNLSEGVTTVR